MCVQVHKCAEDKVDSGCLQLAESLDEPVDCQASWSS